MDIKVIQVGFLKTNCILVYDKQKNAVVFDPGDHAIKIEKTITDAGLSLKAIVFTHVHFDHMNGAAHLLKRFNAKVYAHTSAGSEASHYGVTIKIDKHLKEGDTLKVGDLAFHVLETPGHTPCSLCFICGDLLITGDTLFAGTCGRTDLAGGNEVQIKASLKRLKNLKGDYRVIPGHGKETTLEIEKQDNITMR